MSALPLKSFVIAFVSTILFSVIVTLIFNGVSGEGRLSEKSFKNNFFNKKSINPEPTINSVNLNAPVYISEIPTPSPTIKAVLVNDFVYMIVNKQTSIGKFVPPDLVQLNKTYTNNRYIRVSNLIVKDLISMIDAAAKDKVILRVVSGYRSYSDQTVLFESYVKKEMSSKNISREEAVKTVNTFSAFPGYSEHQLGTTVDVLSPENNYSFDKLNDDLIFVKWINNNAAKYNFHISFPKGNSEYIYEPWHLRWMPSKS